MDFHLSLTNVLQYSIQTFYDDNFMCVSSILMLNIC